MENKEKYESPKMDIVVFDTEDVIEQSKFETPDF